MPVHLLWFITLGCFWGLTPSLYKLMGEHGLPITHIIVYTGLIVGVALALVPLARGRLVMNRGVMLYGLGCAALLNVPFAMSLFFSRHVAATEYALIVSTAPFWNYLLALATGREIAHPRRIGGLMVGFLSSAVLILSRGETVGSGISLWVLAAFAVPIVYSAYNWFAAAYWPKNADIMTVGAAESVFSGLLAIPFMLILAPPWSEASPQLSAYWTAGLASLLWIVERIAFFALIREKGAFYTIQAIYVSTPAAVLWAIFIFGMPADPWIWVSLAILMVALWLNNSRRRVLN
ncbi:DMT family transporter [Taklimakanibacter deserti]|uniref:DMT family transporter n=1 Tax=Taklimakanibacter deserti TaxID=2267839 RepID=UPI000E65E4FE